VVRSIADADMIMNLVDLRDFLADHLLESVVPFWMRYALDDSGGINTCIRDDGTLINRDKWLWSQWRAVWVFSRLYNQIQRRPEWRDAAHQIYRFAARYGWDDRCSGWRLRVAHDGAVLDGCESIYVDGFAIYGLTELARATGEAAVVDLACKTADAALRRLAVPHDQIPLFPYPAPPGARVHGVPMLFSLCFWELGQLVDDPRYRDAAAAMFNDIFAHFYRQDRKMLVERIAEDNSEYPPPLGTAVNPGHVIEDMWFQMHIARDRKDSPRMDLACELILRHLELGWDETYGGLFLAVDADGRADVGWPFADAKLWWPHTEALYATLLAYEYTRDPRFMDWYWRIHNYSFRHYPVPQYGEWTQKLDRRGNPLAATVALPVKDPFHLPRALLYCLEVLERLMGSA
jgi:N-acylglucosamine 2-epimerase